MLCPYLGESTVGISTLMHAVNSIHLNTYVRIYVHILPPIFPCIGYSHLSIEGPPVYRDHYRLMHVSLSDTCAFTYVLSHKEGKVAEHLFSAP